MYTNNIASADVTGVVKYTKYCTRVCVCPCDELRRMTAYQSVHMFAGWQLSVPLSLVTMQVLPTSATYLQYFVEHMNWEIYLRTSI